MLEQVLIDIHNWFRVRDSVGGIHIGEYIIKDGEITLPFLQDGQYFRIIGSVFNDGLHRYGPDMESLQDETFDGAVWALAIPKSVIDDVEEKEKIEAKIQEITASFADSGFTSESFGGYTYQKDVSSQLESLNEQKNEIMKRLNKHRKLSEL